MVNRANDDPPPYDPKWLEDPDSAEDLPEMPSLCWPVMAFLCSWPLGFCTCALYVCSVQKQQERGNAKEMRNAIVAMKCSAIAAIILGSIYVAVLLLVTYGPVDVFDSTNQVFGFPQFPW